MDNSQDTTTIRAEASGRRKRPVAPASVSTYTSLSTGDTLEDMVSSQSLSPDLLLVTVNQHETKALLKAFEDATKSRAKPVPIGDRVYRDLGTVNGTRVFHALSEMGSTGLGGALQTVEKAIQALRPSAVIAVGIAFGVNEAKQAIGDILISQQLRPYELQRAGASICLRSDKPHASPRLLNFFVGVAQTSWRGAKIKTGVLLSGEKLVDNVDYRAQLLSFEPEAIGGEMEGAGLYVACHDSKVDWIVIKAICDWADGEKAKDKTARQGRAAKNAAKFVLHALQQVPLSQTTSAPSIRTGLAESLLTQISADVGTTASKTGELATSVADLRDIVKSLTERQTISERERLAISVLIEQASVHMERGLEKQSSEEYQASINHLIDALNLVRKVDPDPALRGRILVPLAAAETHVGKLEDSIAHYQEAVAALASLPDLEKHFWHARAGLAVALFRAQRYGEAADGLAAALAHYESKKDDIEILRTFTHLVELNLNRSSLKEAIDWGRRLLEHTKKPALWDPMTAELLSALGALSSIKLAVGLKMQQVGDRECVRQLKAAEEEFLKVEKLADDGGLVFHKYVSMSQRARCLWYQSEHGKASEIFETLVKLAQVQFGKLAADTQFNYACMLREQGRNEKARRLFQNACRRYVELGDTASANDAREQIRELRL
jgi:nucleoside phosphorylase